MNKKRYIFLIFTILWCYVIYSFSQSTGESSGSLSLKITHWLLSVVYPNFETLDPKIIEILHLMVRKGAHMTEYAILYFLSFNFISTYKLNNKKTYLYPFLFSVGYAFLDEVHQLLVAGRAGKLMDVGIDTCGVLVMMGLIVLVKKFVSAKKTMI